MTDLSFSWKPADYPLRCQNGGACYYPDGWPDKPCHRCYVLLDELLWALFGWLWLLGGRSELETWKPDEARIAGVDDDELAECWCPIGCGAPIIDGACSFCGFELEWPAGGWL